MDETGFLRERGQGSDKTDLRILIRIGQARARMVFSGAGHLMLPVTNFGQTKQTAKKVYFAAAPMN